MLLSQFVVQVSCSFEQLSGGSACFSRIFSVVAVPDASEVFEMLVDFFARFCFSFQERFTFFTHSVPSNTRLTLISLPDVLLILQPRKQWVDRTRAWLPITLGLAF